METESVLYVALRTLFDEEEKLLVHGKEQTEKNG
ncbi:MAG: hypothetical protein ACJAU0_001840 [Flavobacteriales bacterium]|jgi:hypothetical protein